MVSREKFAIAVDLGGTRMRVAVVNQDGVLIRKDVEPTLAHQGREQVMERLTRAIARLISTTDREKLVGIGVSLAGPVDPNTATIYNPPNLPGWDGFSPRSLLEATFHLSMWAANDATLAAVGEHAYGIGKGVSDLVYMTVSTGIGGGVIVDNRPLLGAGGFAGEIGHMSIDRNGPLCKCGNIGCLEVLASGTAIARIALERLEQRGESFLQDAAMEDPARITAKVVMEAAAQGDPLAGDVVHQFARDLGLGLVNLLHVFNPQMIVLGGGVSQNLHLFFPPLMATIRRYAMGHIKKHIPIVPSILGDDAALLGAAHMAFQGEQPRSG